MNRGFTTCSCWWHIQVFILWNVKILHFLTGTAGPGFIVCSLFANSNTGNFLNKFSPENPQQPQTSETMSPIGPGNLNLGLWWVLYRSWNLSACGQFTFFHTEVIKRPQHRLRTGCRGRPLRSVSSSFLRDGTRSRSQTLLNGIATWITAPGGACHCFKRDHKWSVNQKILKTRRCHV